jgi:glycosyltransferase involved in cell wall biosynthesis
MKFTIVTPSYQQGLYLERTIQSVLSQVGPTVEVEYFILDNCSTDSTLEILKKYENYSNSQLKIKVIVASDRGQADAINQGWELGTGDVFAWLNADDVYLEGALSRVVESFKANPKVDAIYGEALYLDHNDRVIKPVTNIRDYSKQALRTHDFITQPATFLRRSVVRQTGQLSLNYRYAFDWDYWIRVSENYELVRVGAVLAGYRVTGENLTSTGRGKRLQEMLGIVWRYGGVRGLIQFGERLVKKYAAGQIELPSVRASEAP